MTGNTLGARRYYKYTNDNDEVYSYLTDKDLGDAVGDDLDDSNPPFPRRFKPRGVYVQATIDNRLTRKFLVIGDTSNDLWSDSSETIEIDGVSFSSTGRRGEALSFGGNPSDGGGGTGDGGGTGGGGGTP